MAERPASDRLPPLTATRVFEAVARHGSFARAAEELEVSPAAVSQHIQTLEDWAGQPLFRRLGRGVELTDAGQAARPLVHEAVLLLADAGRLMRAALRAQRVSVSVAPSFAAKWLVPRLERFKERWPDIEVWIAADMAPVDFATADVDLAIRYGPGGYRDSNSERLLSESVAPLCSPGLIAEGLRTPEDLRRFALLHDESSDRDPSCPTWDMWLAARGIAGIETRRGLRFNQASLVIEAAAAGKGVALAKRQLAAADLQAGRLATPFEGDETPLAYAYWLVWPRGRTMTAALRAFMEWLRGEAAPPDADLGAGI